MSDHAPYQKRTAPRARVVSAFAEPEYLSPSERRELEEDRPRNRSECRGHEGPCPWVGCRYHLYLDVNPVSGSIKINFPHLEPWELAETCALDVAEQEHDLEQVGSYLNMTRARVGQVVDEIRHNLPFVFALKRVKEA